MQERVGEWAKVDRSGLSGRCGLAQILRWAIIPSTQGLQTPPSS
jgi:hypothetical protein